MIQVITTIATWFAALDERVQVLALTLICAVLAALAVKLLPATRHNRRSSPYWLCYFAVSMLVITTLFSAFWLAINMVPSPVFNVSSDVLIGMGVCNTILALAALLFYRATRPPLDYRRSDE